MCCQWHVASAQVADRWVVQSCVEACEAAILFSGPLDFPINGMFLLPTMFAESQVASRIMKQAVTYLMKLYKDLRMILGSPQDLESFKRLPAQAVLTLFHSENLNTDSEATVVVLLSIWFAGNGDNCNSEMHSALNRMVRYGFLSPSFVCTALPHMPNLQLTQEQISELVMLSSARHQLGKHEWQASRQICPQSWCVERGRLHVNQGHVFHIRLGIPAAQLRAHVIAVSDMQASNASRPSQIESHTFMAQGYEWKLVLSSNNLDTAFALDVHVRLPAGPPTAVVGVQCTIELSVYKEEGSRLLVAPTKRCFSGSARLTRLKCGNQAEAGDPRMEQWEEMMQDNHLCIQAAIRVL